MTDIPNEHNHSIHTLLVELDGIAHGQPLWPGDTLSHAIADACVALGWAQRTHEGFRLTSIGELVLLAQKAGKGAPHILKWVVYDTSDHTFCAGESWGSFREAQLCSSEAEAQDLADYHDAPDQVMIKLMVLEGQLGGDDFREFKAQVEVNVVINKPHGDPGWVEVADTEYDGVSIPQGLNAADAEAVVKEAVEKGGLRFFDFLPEDWTA